MTVPGPDEERPGPRYGRFAHWRSQEPPPDQRMANWALGLALLGCFCGVTALVAAAFAVVVIDRSGDGVDLGRRKAVAALVVSAAQIFALGYVVPRALDWWQPDYVPPAEPRSSYGYFRADQLMVGDCFNDAHVPARGSGTGASGLQTAAVTVVPCRHRHWGEVVDVFHLEGTDYPADGARAQATATCRPALTAYVAGRRASGPVRLWWYVPSEASWEVGDDVVVCFAVDRDGRTRTSSLGHPSRVA